MDQSVTHEPERLTVDPMLRAEEGSAIPPVDRTLTWVVALMRFLGWAWMIVLTITAATEEPEAVRSILVGAVLVATGGAGVTVLAIRRGFLGKVGYVVFDGAIAVLLLAAGWIAGVGEFVAGGYPMSWLFVVAYATNLRWTLLASLLLSAESAILHEAMDLSMIRIVGSIQFVLVSLVAGWTFDSLRQREELRVAAETERAAAEEQLANERENAARLRERSEIARRLHDSVLQTLKLISAEAGDASEVRYLARAQERDLRRTINEYRSPYEDSFQARLLDARDSVEDLFRVEVEAVISNDAEMTPQLRALIAAATEAMTNAARHSGQSNIDLYANVRDDGIQVNIRDRGRGFDPTANKSGGLSHSIIDRVSDAGGTVDINTAIGSGTDVSLFLPLS